ncbi:hypothetical protein AB1Y20_016354 [Prymnesium parvum]|uniref:Uncharacterized protein n=1 Tax=Prymnesium parvum TaxID=97485 RepID=A0AB34IFQ0_PRYPA
MSDLQKLVRIADAITQSTLLLEEHVGAVADDELPLFEHYPSGPLLAFEARLNELLRRSALPPLRLSHAPTLRAVHERIHAECEAALLHAAGWPSCCTRALSPRWPRAAVGAIRAHAPRAWVRAVAASSPRAVAEGVRLAAVGALVLALLLAGYLLKPSAALGVAPHAPPPPPLLRRAVRHRPFRKGPVEDLVELHPPRLPRKSRRSPPPGARNSTSREERHARRHAPMLAHNASNATVHTSPRRMRKG